MFSAKTYGESLLNIFNYHNVLIYLEMFSNPKGMILKRFDPLKRFYFCHTIIFLLPTDHIVYHFLAFLTGPVPATYHVIYW